MSELSPLPEPASTDDGGETPAARKRPKPGERRVQILQALAAMLEQPGAERITTAALAARLSVSEAALYRHFASKAQLFEGLIDFIEQTVFTQVQQITGRDVPDPDQSAEVGTRQAARIVALLLQFGERNPGMVRVMVGDALVFEHERLQQRMNQFFDRIESTLRQCLRPAVAGSATPTVDAQVAASVLTAFAVGRLQRYARSGFKRLPPEHLEASLALILCYHRLGAACRGRPCGGGGSDGVGQRVAPPQRMVWVGLPIFSGGFGRAKNLLQNRTNVRFYLPACPPPLHPARSPASRALAAVPAAPCKKASKPRRPSSRQRWAWPRTSGWKACPLGRWPTSRA